MTSKLNWCHFKRIFGSTFDVLGPRTQESLGKHLLTLNNDHVSTLATYLGYQGFNVWFVDVLGPRTQESVGKFFCEILFELGIIGNFNLTTWTFSQTWANDHSSIETNIYGSNFQYAASEQRPLVNIGHKFRISRVVVVHKFNFISKKLLNISISHYCIKNINGIPPQPTTNNNKTSSYVIFRLGTIFALNFTTGVYFSDSRQLIFLAFFPTLTSFGFEMFYAVFNG